MSPIHDQAGLVKGGNPLPQWVAAPSLTVQAAVASSVLLVWLLSEALSANLLSGPSISGWYPTAGIGLAVLWALGLRYLWVIGLSAALGMFAVWEHPWATILAGTVVKVLTYGASAWGLRRVLPPPVSLQRPTQVAFMLLLFLGCAFSTALLSVAVYGALGSWNGPFGAGVLSWMIGDAIGILVITPLLLLVVAPWVCDRYCHQSPSPPGPGALARPWREATTLITGTALAIILLYITAASEPDFRVFYLGFIALPALAIGYGLAGGLSALFVLNAAGMFVIALLGADTQTLQDLQLVMIALAICTLLVGSFSSMRAVAAAAAESGERWADLAFRGSGLGRWHWRVGTETYETDHVLTDVMGYPAAEVDNDFGWWRQRMHPEDLPEVNAAMRRHLEGHAEYFDAEFRVRDAKGDWVWIYSQGKVIERDEHKRPSVVVGTHSEITERKRLKELQEESEAWHRSEQRFRLLADAAPVGIFQTDEQGAFLYMNPAWSEITGFDLNDALYRHAGAFAYADDRNLVADAWATAVQSRTGMSCEHRVLTPAGEVRWIATFARPTAHAQGRPGGFVGTAVDVTEYREQVQLIRDSETRYRTLADQAHDMLWRVTLDAVFTYVSPSCEPLMGLTPAEMVGTNAYDYFHPDDAAQVRSKHEALTLEAPQFKDLHRYRRKDGSYIWFEAVGQLVVPQGNPAGTYIVGISRDVTARIEAEQQSGELETRLRRSQKLDAIGTFATGIAHDFRNTLLAIAASVQSAQKKLDPAHPAARPLDLIEDACRQSMEITQSLLTFTRGQGRNKEIADLSTLVTDTTRLLGAMLPSTVRIQSDLPDTAPRVRCNPSELQQVIMNLATNARDALGEPGGNVDISLTNSDDGHAILRVADRGQGMSADTLNRAFEPFFTTKSRLKGTGLGLALVHGIVSEHDGDIQIDSTPQHGTTVTITLPTVPKPTDVSPFPDLLTTIEETNR